MDYLKNCGHFAGYLPDILANVAYHLNDYQALVTRINLEKSERSLYYEFCSNAIYTYKQALDT